MNGTGPKKEERKKKGKMYMLTRLDKVPRSFFPYGKKKKKIKTYYMLISREGFHVFISIAVFVCLFPELFFLLYFCLLFFFNFLG